MRAGASALLDKVNVTEIVRHHYATLYDNAKGKPRGVDFLLFLGLPALVGSLPIWTSVALSSTGGLLAATSLVGGLFFALLIMVLQMAAETAARAEQEGVEARLLRRVKVLREISANVSYSVLVAIVAVVVLVAGEFLLPPGVAPRPGKPIPRVSQPTWFSCLALFVLSHFAVSLLMVLKRTFAVTRRELDLASVPPSRDGR